MERLPGKDRNEPVKSIAINWVHADTYQMHKDSCCGHSEWKPRASRRIAVFTLVLASLLHVHGAQPLTFAPPQLDSSGQLLFPLRGEPNTTYVLETSTDLSEWVPLFSAITSASGQLDFSLSRQTNLPTAFYFARSQTDLEKLIVIPQPDENYATVALITTDGGTCSLTNQNGVSYTFTVPPFAVTESVAITMTLLTNVVGFPLTNGFGTAVSFEPEGLEFWAPGILEIRYPTNIAMLDVVSYTFGGDGREMYLLPDLVSSNTVTIPVLHFSGVGSSSGGKQAASTFAHKAINNPSSRASHQMAQAGLAARAKGKAQASGEVILTAGEVVTSPGFTLTAGEVHLVTVQEMIERYKHDCTDFMKSARERLGIGKKVKLFGGADETATAYLLSSCEAFANCLKEAKDLCPFNPSLAIKKFSALQQVMARVPGCPAPDENQFLRECQPEWFGSVSYYESGTTNIVATIDCTTRDFSNTITNSGTAYVVSSILGIPGSVTLDLEGPASSFNRTKGIENQTCPCPKVSTGNGAAAGTGTLKFRLVAQFIGGQLLLFQFVPLGDIALTGWGSVSVVWPPCHTGDEESRDFSSTKLTGRQAPFSLTVSAPSIGSSLSFVTPDSIVGTYTAEVFSSGIPVTATWTFDLRRKQ